MRPIKRLALILSSLFLIFSFMLPEFSVTAASGPAITSTLTDNAIQKGSKKTFDVWAKNSAGEKIKATVKLNGKIVAPTWDDSEKTSYTLIFTEEGENIVTVSASSDGGRRRELTYHITYVRAEAGEQIGTAIWSVELFTIGCGYLICPVSVPIYEGETSAEQLIRLLHNSGFTGYYGGTPKSAFYLGYIADGTVSAAKYNNYQKSGTPSEPKLLDLSPKIPDILIPYLENTMTFFDSNDYLNNWRGYIGEFAFTNGSGWMYSVNNNFPNVGFADTYLSDGDVVRVQYTLAYGADIGGLGSIGENVPDLDVQPTSGYFAVANKDGLCKAISRALTSGNISKIRVKTAYDAAVSVMAALNASQRDVDFAVNTLNSSLLDPGTETETALPETQPAADLPETDLPAVSDRPSDTEIPPEFVGPVRPSDSEREPDKVTVPDIGTSGLGGISDRPVVPSVPDSDKNSGSENNKKPSVSAGTEKPGISSGVGSPVNKPSDSGNVSSELSNKPSNSLLPSAPSSIIGVFRPSGLTGTGGGKPDLNLPSSPGNMSGLFAPSDFTGISNEFSDEIVTSDGDSTEYGDNSNTQEPESITDTFYYDSAEAGNDTDKSPAAVKKETENSTASADGSGKSHTSARSALIAGITAVVVAAAIVVFLCIRRRSVKISGESESEGEDRND